MNREWADKNKAAQSKLKKGSFVDGIHEYIELRKCLMQEMLSWKEELSLEDYYAIPFINAKGYHSKTIAYSIWHIIRIEDIVVNTLIRDTKEILFEKEFDKKIGTDIITTGNELVKQEIADFSRTLNIGVLYEYADAVRISTDAWLEGLCYENSKRKFDEIDANRILKLGVVANDENAIWLIDYWCRKDVLGLIKMPLSRHWIMHIEAANRIKEKIK